MPSFPSHPQKYFQTTMSYYGIHHANIDAIICANCQMEVFAWLSDVFACPKCGHKFHEANDSDEDREMHDDEYQEMYEDDDSDVSTLDLEEERVDRKRKREELSEGDGH
jgi:uncharacterized CHY-type Zn-finger protein